MSIDRVYFHINQEFSTITDPPSYAGSTTYSVVEGASNYIVLLTLDANPLPQEGNFSWFFSDRLLTETESEIELEVNSIRFALVDRNQAGIYRVLSANLVASGEFTFQLIIYCKMLLNNIYFVN